MKTQILHEEWKPIEGKIAVFIMSFSGDSECLIQCLRGIDEQKKRGYNLEVFVIDDANNPLELTEEQLANVHYKKSYFPRNGNLNGTQCAQGMLMEMLRCCRECKAQYVMKVDSDMYIRTLERFLKPLEEDPNKVIGFKLSKDMCYCAGVTYILPVTGLYKAIKDFYDWFKSEKANQDKYIQYCPEDWAITRCVTSVNNYTMCQWDNSTNPENWLLAPFNFREIEADGTINPLCFSRFTMYDFVNFGNRYELDQECKCESLLAKKSQRQIAAHFMKSFIDFDLNNTFTN